MSIFSSFRMDEGLMMRFSNAREQKQFLLMEEPGLSF
jgi:hypothetical protein